ncbi:hypothetical protein [Leadbettera azotonutricia]|uniref:Putative lipoprotein n=1 Tax=Leadbettera azotonutricia (strain ATCC BAA-888 / DSM 13862 / ZAS-9) TaxID=545695 RepID=F5Y719_LEAAZ|nr:hypothetical protein [Leadbettera azotonutricia]AEF80687.1 putative lipoprotein [Leadbettera azotonutricia ZAS-9]
MAKVKIPRVFPILGVVLIWGGLFVSCTEFFSTSLAPWAARNPDNIIPAVTTGNVDELIAMTENNPDMSLAVLKKIEDAAKNATGDAKTALQTAALEAAVNATGMGSAVLNNVDKLVTVDEDNAKKLVLDAIHDMKNLDASCKTLMGILPPPPPITYPPTPDPAFDAFTANANPDELAMAAAMLLAGELNKQDDPEAYINDFDPKNINDPESSANLAAALALVAAIDYDTIEDNGPLRQLLDGLHLLPDDYVHP